MSASESQSTQPSGAGSSSRDLEPRLKVYDRILATISSICVIAGGLAGLFSYSASKRNEANHQRHELDLLLFKERKDAYYSLVDAASEIAACRTREEVVKSAPSFDKLYVGRAHLIVADGNNHVYRKKIDFEETLRKYLDGEDKNSSKTPFDYFKSNALALTDACHDTLKKEMTDLHLDYETRSDLQKQDSAGHQSDYLLAYSALILLLAMLPAYLLISRLKAWNSKQKI